MKKIAICNSPKSRVIIEERIVDFFGASKDCEFFEFENVETMVSTEAYFDLIFINKNLIGEMDALIKYIAQETEKQNAAKISQEYFSFVSYIDDPISEKDCAKFIEHIRQILGYTSMYIAAEFLTDKGLRSIALSKILFFEFHNRKIRIKTKNSEYFCDDTLKNVLSLFGAHDFYQVHKAYIVNLKHVAGVKNYAITMNDESIVPLSQKKSSEFRKIYKAYLEQHPTQVTKKPRKIQK